MIVPASYDKWRRSVEEKANTSMAFDNSLQEAHDNGKVFSPQNWSKNESSLAAIRAAIRTHISAIGMIPGGAEIKKEADAWFKDGEYGL